MNFLRQGFQKLSSDR